MTPILPLLSLLLICPTMPLRDTHKRLVAKAGKDTTRKQKTARKPSGDYIYIRGQYHSHPPLSELQRRFGELKEKNRKQGRQMTLREHYEEVMDMLATSRLRVLEGKKDQAQVLLSDALHEFKLYREAFKAHGFAMMAMDESFKASIQTLEGIKETGK